MNPWLELLLLNFIIIHKCEYDLQLGQCGLWRARYCYVRNFWNCHSPSYKRMCLTLKAKNCPNSWRRNRGLHPMSPVTCTSRRGQRRPHDLPPCWHCLDADVSVIGAACHRRSWSTVPAADDPEFTQLSHGRRSEPVMSAAANRVSWHSQSSAFC